MMKLFEIMVGIYVAKCLIRLLNHETNSSNYSSQKQLVSDKKYVKYVNMVINEVKANQYFSTITKQISIYLNQNEMKQNLLSKESRLTMRKLNEKDKIIRIKNKQSYNNYKIYKQLEILSAITPSIYGLQFKPLLDTFYRIFISIKDKEEMIEFDLAFSEIFSLDQSTDSLLTSLDYLYSVESTASILYLFKTEIEVRNKFNKKLVELNKSLEEFIKFNKNLNPLSNLDSIRETLS